MLITAWTTPCSFSNIAWCSGALTTAPRAHSIIEGNVLDLPEISVSCQPAQGGLAMKIVRSVRWAGAAVAATPGLASAGPLTIVEVGAPAINCVFQTSCVIPVTDSSAPI